MSLTPGATLGPYTIRTELGHGGMGVVYMAKPPRSRPSCVRGAAVGPYGTHEPSARRASPSDSAAAWRSTPAGTQSGNGASSTR